MRRQTYGDDLGQSGRLSVDELERSPSGSILMPDLASSTWAADRGPRPPPVGDHLHEFLGVDLLEEGIGTATRLAQAPVSTTRADRHLDAAEVPVRRGARGRHRQRGEAKGAPLRRHGRRGAQLADRQAAAALKMLLGRRRRADDDRRGGARRGPERRGRAGGGARGARAAKEPQLLGLHGDAKEAARRTQGNRESPLGFLSCGNCEKRSVILLEPATSDP